MVNINPSLSNINDPLEISLNIESDQDKEILIDVKIILDVVYKNQEMEMVKKNVKLIKGNNLLNVKYIKIA
jgi:hypothetical protein